MILCKKIDKILHLDSKIVAIFFETSKDMKPKLSFDLTSNPVTFDPINFYHLEELSCFDLSEECPIASFESKQDDCESCDSEISLHFAYQLLKDESVIDDHVRHQLLKYEPEDDIIQSSSIVGSLCGQCHRSNESPHSSE